MEGFVSVFAEYAYKNISGGQPSLYIWKPIVCMTEEELKNKRVAAEKFADDYESLKGDAGAKSTEVNHA